MEFIYLGVCYVGQEDLPEFFKTGKELQVEGLMGEEPDEGDQTINIKLNIFLPIFGHLEH